MVIFTMNQPIMHRIFSDYPREKSGSDIWNCGKRQSKPILRLLNRLVTNQNTLAVKSVGSLQVQAMAHTLI